MISIRPEEPTNYDAIDSVTVDAFANSEFGHNGEAQLIRQLRNKYPNAVSLVASDADAVVGHILFAPITCRTANGEWHGMGLAPMSVAPARQKGGIGRRLITSGIERLTASGISFVAVLGHPEYYTRFGFRPAADFGLRHGFEGIPQNVFFIRNLSRQPLKSTPESIVIYDAAFGPQIT